MPTKAALGPIEYYLPKGVLSNEELAAVFPDWTADKIVQKTGIAQRHIAGPDECSSDLVFNAAEQLFASGVDRESIDYLLFCTQAPDYFLPTTACVLQKRLGLRENIGALDFNLGCSGFIYGLGLSKALVENGQAKNVLLLNGDTYSKFIHAQDKSVRTLFGDAGAATLVQAVESERDLLGPFVYGTDGGGSCNLMVPTGGIREPRTEASGVAEADSMGNVRSRDNLYMNGPAIFNFTLKIVPATIQSTLEAAGLAADDIDMFVFHQANQYMLEHLRKKLGIPPERFAIALDDTGNTVSATIPIALAKYRKQGLIKPGMLTMLVGFGVGYSWGATLARV